MRVKIGDVTKIRTGKLDANASSEEGQYPFFTCSREPLRISTYSYDCECVLVAGNGDLNVKYYNGKFDAYQRTYIIEDNSGGKLYMPYLYYFMEGYIEELRKQAIGGVIKYIKLGNLTNALIELPSIHKQRAIVDILEKIRNVIAMRNAEVNKLENLVRARFVELFGDPETNPNSWDITKLSRFCDLKNGYAFRSGDYVESSAVLNCRMSNIRPDGGFDAEYHPKFLPDEFWDRYKEYRLKDGDVIIAMTDMANDPKILGVPTIVKTNGKRFLLNQRVGKLTFYNTECINNVYLMFVLSQKHIRQQLVKNAGGSTQINVGKPAILGIEFFVPPMELQEQFAAFVAQVAKSKFTKTFGPLRC